MIVVDTTVLVYAVGSAHPLRDPCRGLVERIGDGELRATTTVEVIQELAHVRARRRDRKDAASIAAAFAELLAPLMRPDLEDLQAGLALFRKTIDLGAFDAVLAATAIRSGADALISADGAFSKVRELTTIDPSDEAALDALTR